MKSRSLSLVGLAGILILVACSTSPPDLEHSLYLYQQGHINEARRDMAAYLRAKPFNPESEEARQHILLIRRIKQLESIAIDQWRRGNVQGASRLVGIMRILHPVYVDSSEIFQIIDFSRPPLMADTTRELPRQVRLDLADSTTQTLAPYALAVLDCQEELIIHLAKEWEIARYQEGNDPIKLFATSITGTDTRGLVQAVTSANEALEGADTGMSYVTELVNQLSEQLDQFLLEASSDTQQTLLSFEYGFQDHKSNLLRQILEVKSQLRTPGIVSGQVSSPVVSNSAGELTP